MRGYLNRFKKLIRWIPIIWKTRDWDYIYLLILIRHQLEDMIKYSESVDIHEGQLRIEDEMHICVSLIKKIENDKHFRGELYIKHLMNTMKSNMKGWWI